MKLHLDKNVLNNLYISSYINVGFLYISPYFT